MDIRTRMPLLKLEKQIQLPRQKLIKGLLDEKSPVANSSKYFFQSISAQCLATQFGPWDSAFLLPKFQQNQSEDPKYVREMQCFVISSAQKSSQLHPPRLPSVLTIQRHQCHSGGKLTSALFTQGKSNLLKERAINFTGLCRNGNQMLISSFNYTSCQ